MSFNTTLFHKVAFKKLLLATCAFLFLFSMQYAEAATLSVSPNTGVYTAGATFTARVVINTKGQPINAAEGSLSFNPSELSVVGVSKGVIFSLWTTDPSYSNGAGTITFGGGSPKGYTGSAGIVMNITFRTKTAGTAKMIFKSGSVLAADGRGTNILTSMNGGSFTIVAADFTPEPETIQYIAPANTPASPDVTSSTHTSADEWFAKKEAQLSWTLPDDVIAVRTLLDKNSGSIPTKVYETPIHEISLDELEEGLQYFHIQFKNAEGWGRVAHYRLAVDTEKPSSFNIKLVDEADLSNPKQILIFDVEDTTSGIERYLVQINGGEPYEYIDTTSSSTILLPELNPGHHSVIIEAFDYAGNSLIGTFSFNILAFDKPQFTEYPSEMNQEVIPVIKGVTRPDSEVTVTVHRAGATDDPSSSGNVYTIRSDKSGEFVFIPEGRFTVGVYELVAVATDQHGAKSEQSDRIRIAVQEPGYVQIGALAISVMSILVPLLALLLVSIFMFVYFFRKVRVIRTYVIKETDEALSILEKEFAKLRTTLNEQKDILIASRKSKKLTKGENTLTTEMSTALRKAESIIKSEISDVDDIVE